MLPIPDMENSSKPHLMLIINNNNDTSSKTDIEPGWASMKWIIIAVDLLMIIPICMGNILVILAYKNTTKLRNMANIPLINLCVADLTTGLISIPWTCFNNYYFNGILHNKWRCVFLFPFLHIPIGVSGITMLVIAILRFMAVRFPLKYKSFMTRCRIKFILVLAWIYMISLCCGFVVFANTWNENVIICTFSDVIPKSYMIAIGGHIVIVGIVASAIYIYIGKKVQKRDKKVDMMRKGTWNKGPVSEYIQSPSISSSAEYQTSVALKTRITSENENPGKQNCINMTTEEGQPLKDIECAEKSLEMSKNDNENDDKNDIKKSTENVWFPTNHVHSGWGNVISEYSKGAPKLHKVQRHKTNSTSSGGHIKSNSVSEHKPQKSRKMSLHNLQRFISRQTSGLATKTDSKTVKMLSTVLICFFLCWVPFLVNTVCSVFIKGEEPVWLSIFGEFSLSALFANSFINPLIYAGMDKTFKRAFMKLLCPSLIDKSGGMESSFKQPSSNA